MAHRDEIYIQGIRSQDRAIIHKIYDRYQGKIISMVRRNYGDTEDGEDIFQRALGEVLFRMVQRPDFTLTSQFYTLLYGISKRLWQRELQKKRRNLITDKPSDELSYEIESIQEQREREILLWGHIENLSEDCSSLYLMTIKEHLSEEEIASRLGLENKGSVKVKRARCKKKLSESLRSDPRYMELSRQMA